MTVCCGSKRETLPLIDVNPIEVEKEEEKEEKEEGVGEDEVEEGSVICRASACKLKTGSLNKNKKIDKINKIHAKKKKKVTK